MHSQVIGLRVAGTDFGLMALVQLARLLTQSEILIAGHPLPLWASAVAVVFLGALSVWMWALSRARAPAR